MKAKSRSLAAHLCDDLSRFGPDGVSALGFLHWLSGGKPSFAMPIGDMLPLVACGRGRLLNVMERLAELRAIDVRYSSGDEVWWTVLDMPPPNWRPVARHPNERWVIPNMGSRVRAGAR